MESLLVITKMVSDPVHFDCTILRGRHGLGNIIRGTIKSELM